MDETNHLYTLGPEDKSTQVMAYTASSLLLGEVVTKKVIRVSTWLRTPMMPQYITLYGVQLFDFSVSGNPHPMTFKELYLPSSQVIAFHIRPPACDPLDYEPNEPMRKMEPVTALVGPFRFDGSVRMSTQTNLGSYLEVVKEVFTSMYDIQINPIHSPTIKPFEVQYALLRRDLVCFSPRPTAR